MEPNPIDARPLSPLDPKDAKEIAKLLKEPKSTDDLVKLFQQRQISVGVGDNDSEIVLPYGRTISEDVLRRKKIKRKLKFDPPNSKKKKEGGRKRKRKTRKKRKKKTKKRRRKKRHRKKRTKRRK
jgi:hypothetical protein